MQALLLLFIVILEFSVYACQKLRYLLTMHPLSDLHLRSPLRLPYPLKQGVPEHANKRKN